MRPYRNPNGEVMPERANRAYLQIQMTLPEEIRQDDWMLYYGEDLREWPDWVGDDVRNMTNDELRIYRELEAVDALNRIGGLGRAARPREDAMAHNRQMVKDYPPLNLDKLEPGPCIPRDIKLPPFKIDYDSHGQIHQKLHSTIILIKDRPFQVHQTADLGKGKFALLVNDQTGIQGVVNYDDIKDCRSIAPGYFNYRGNACWTYRVPERQNSQGMSRRNMQYRIAGSGLIQQAREEFLLQALGVAKDVQYAPNLHDVLLGGNNPSLRLSNRVALYLTGKKGAPIGVEYCGRVLGLIVRDQVKVMDACDLQPSWIHKDLHKVNLVMGE